jgi:Rrf2 family protein
MKLSTRVRYGLRALVELADVQKESPVLLDSVAQKQGISRKYLDAIFARLKTAGIVTSSRGAGGGFMLTRTPQQINLLQVYEGLEGKMSLVDCDVQDRHCGRQENCSTTEVWHEVSRLMADYMLSVDLAMLVKEKREKERKNSEMYYI